MTSTLAVAVRRNMPIVRCVLFYGALFYGLELLLGFRDQDSTIPAAVAVGATALLAIRVPGRLANTVLDVPEITYELVMFVYSLVYLVSYFLSGILRKPDRISVGTAAILVILWTACGLFASSVLGWKTAAVILSVVFGPIAIVVLVAVFFILLLGLVSEPCPESEY